MKKLINFLLIVTFHFGYLEWGENNSSFIFQAEAEIFKKAGSGLENIAHPLIIVPFIGILLLLITLFQSQPSKRLTFIGLGCLSILMLVLLLVGILGGNFKILLSVVPFFTVATILILKFRRRKETTS